MATISAAAPQAPFSLRDPRNPRLAIFLLACLITAVGATGFTAHTMFQQPSTLKYVITVAGPALVALLATMQNPLRVLVLLGILVTPINFVATIHGIQVTPLVAIILLALPVAVLQRARRPAGWLGPAGLVIAALLAPAILAGSPALSFAIWIGETLLLGWLVFGVASEEGGVQSVVSMLAIAAVFEGVICVYEYKTGHKLNLYSSSGTQAAGQNYFFNYGSATRAAGTFEDPISCGNVLAMILPMVICLSVMEKDVIRRVLLGIAGAIATLGLIVTYSRMSWTGGAIGTVLCLVFLPRGARLRTTIAVGTIGVIVVLIGLSVGGAELQKRFTSLLNPTSTQSTYRSTAKTDQLREREWHAALKVFEQEPLLGTGFGKFQAAMNRNGVSISGGSNAQNFYFQVLAESGILGGLALLTLFICTGRDLLVAFRRHRPLVAGVGGAMVAMMIGWSTDVTSGYVQVSGIIVTILATVAAAAGHARRRQLLAGVTPLPRVMPFGLGILGPPVVETPVPSAAPPAGPPTLVLATGATDLTAQLDRLQVPFLVRQIEEPAFEMADPRGAVRRSALHRATNAILQGANETVLAVDTRVVIGPDVFAPPQTEAEARTLLRALSDRTHEVLSAVAIIWDGGARVATTTTAVTMCELSDEQIEWYLGTGEWRGRATGYDIEGLASTLVRRVEGDYQNVTGLPLEALLAVYPTILDR